MPALAVRMREFRYTLEWVVRSGLRRRKAQQGCRLKRLRLWQSKLTLETCWRMCKLSKSNFHCRLVSNLLATTWCSWTSLESFLRQTTQARGKTLALSIMSLYWTIPSRQDSITCSHYLPSAIRSTLHWSFITTILPFTGLLLSQTTCNALKSPSDYHIISQVLIDSSGAFLLNWELDFSRHWDDNLICRQTRVPFRWPCRQTTAMATCQEGWTQGLRLLLHLKEEGSCQQWAALQVRISLLLLKCYKPDSTTRSNLIF